MQSANHSNGGKGVVAATSFSYWARAILAWGVPLVLIAPFVPLAWPRLGVLADTTFVFRTIVLIVFGLAVCVAWEERLRLRWNGVVIALCAVLLVASLATVTAADPSRAFWGDMVRQEGLLHAFVLAAYAFSCAVAFRERATWTRFSYAAVAIALFAAVHAVAWPIMLFFLGGDVPSHRLWGVYVNPLYFGSVMIVTAWTAVGLAGGSARWRTRLLFACAGVLLAYMGIMSGSRSILLALGASILCGVLLFTHKKTRWHVSVFVMVATIVVALAYGALWLVHDWVGVHLPIVSRITNVSFEDQRWQIWRIFLPAVRERWLTGWGPENQLVAYYVHFLPHLYAYTFEIFDRAHNGLLDILLTTGILGLIATLCLGLFLVGAWWKTWRITGSWQALVAMSAAVFYAIYLLFAFDTVFLWIVLIPIFVAPLASGQWSSSQKKFPQLGLFLCVCAVVAVWVGGAALPFLALHQSRTAYMRSKTDMRAGSSLYRSSYQLPSHVRTEVAKMWATAVREAIVLRRGDSADIRAAGEGALAAFAQEHASHPWDPSIPLAMVRLLEGMAELFPEYTGRIRPLLEETMDRHPQRVEAYQLLALRSLRDGQLEEAAELLRTALRINGDVAQTHLEYAVVLARQGRMAQALWQVGQAGLEDGNAMDPAFRLYISLIRLPEARSADGNGSGVVEPGNMPAE